MPPRNHKIHLVSHVKTTGANEYLIVQYRTRGLENVRYFTVHLIDVKSGLLNREPVLELSTPFEQKNRYKDFYADFMGLIVYAISTEKIIPGIQPKYKQLDITFDTLDKWYTEMLTDYQNGRFDSQSICYPEL